ncbi:MAG: Smr/MutS family protein [Flavobacteriales bacterium]
MGFKVGDKVDVVDETVWGVVTRVLPKRVVIYTDSGFEQRYAPWELVLRDELEMDAGSLDIQKIIAEKERPQCQKSLRKHTENRGKDRVEIDLHIEALVDRPLGLSHAEMLAIQKCQAIEKLEESMKKGIARVIFIHGVGKGVLRDELRAIFDRYAHITYCDASYARYGHGATEVQIFKP